MTPPTRAHRTRVMLVCLIVLLFALPGCDFVREKMGWPTPVVDPEKETPEWVVQRVLEASAKEPFDQAFADYAQYLHSSELNSPQGMKEWETLRFPTLRRKHQCYLQPDEGAPYAYHRMERRENRDDYISIFVKCKTSDMPTPCHLFKDPEQGGKWRIKMNCLN